jgi:hypothetical protein
MTILNAALAFDRKDRRAAETRLRKTVATASVDLAKSTPAKRSICTNCGKGRPPRKASQIGKTKDHARSVHRVEADGVLQQASAHQPKRAVTPPNGRWSYSRSLSTTR